MAVEMADSGADLALLRVREAFPATKRRTRWAPTIAEMVGKELVLRKEGALNLRELAARTTLSEVRQKGHAYVELRQVGKRIIFFCTLCLTPCFNDNVLFDHLQGNLHARRLAAAKVTLFGPDPWPFSDGVLFFNHSNEKNPLLPMSSSQNDMALVISERSSGNEEVTSRSRDSNDAEDSNSNGRTSDLDRNGNYPLCVYNGGSSNCNHRGAVTARESTSRSNGASAAKNGHDRTPHGSETDSRLTIPRVLVEEEVSDLSVWDLGIGQIAYRIHEANDARGKISKIWCAWLGLGGSDGGGEPERPPPDCDFAVVNFSYSCYLGRKSAWDDQDSPSSPGSYFEIDDAGRRGKRRKKSFSDQECSSEDLTNHCESAAEDCSGPDGGGAADAPRQLQTRLIPSKVARRELRKQNRLAAEKTCDICGQPMLPGKDVAALLNLRTGNLACSSRNSTGAFHIFHASCLIHWILLCELEILTNQSGEAKPTRGRKGRTAVKNRISSVFCPACQGTGIHVKGEEFEKPTISLAEVFLYKLKAIEAQKAWMKNPEILNRCSTGLHFPSETVENSQEKVVPLKLLRFYRAAE